MPNQDYSIIEFMGWDSNNKELEKVLRDSIKENLANYKIVDIIMYDDPNIKYKPK